MEQTSVNIGFLTYKNPLDKRSWSGTHYYMLKALMKEKFNVVVLGPMKVPRILDKLLVWADKLSLFFTKKKYNKDSSIFLSLYWGHRLRKRIDQHHLDILFAPAASNEFAFLSTTIPICYFTDASFHQLNNYYRYYSNISRFSEKESDFIEKRAIEKASILVYPSRWAADHVKEHYQVHGKRMFIVKFGANLDYVPSQVSIKKDLSRFNLLFIGVDWERKGGPIVLKAFEELLSRGKNVYLTVCGCVPPVSHPKVRVIPFINKNEAEGERQLAEILTNSHVLFLPTRAECFGIVFCEASAFGLPSVTTNTGGVGSVIENGVNGYLLPLNAKSKDYADKIEALIDDPQLYSALTISTRQKYESELNWDEWGKRMRTILMTLKPGFKAEANLEKVSAQNCN